NLAGTTVKVGEKGRAWSLEAWAKARDAWRTHGEDNHLLLSSREEVRKRDLAENWVRKGRMAANGMPQPVNEEALSGDERREYEAAAFMFEYNFYRGLTNFAHHYNRAVVEAKAETVACRKLLDRAERYQVAL